MLFQILRKMFLVLAVTFTGLMAHAGCNDLTNGMYCAGHIQAIDVGLTIYGKSNCTATLFLDGVPQIFDANVIEKPWKTKRSSGTLLEITPAKSNLNSTKIEFYGQLALVDRTGLATAKITYRKDYGDQFTKTPSAEYLTSPTTQLVCIPTQYVR